MLQLDNSSETFKKLNKMNTERLLTVFVKKFNAYPANCFDRKSILQAIKDKINQELAERYTNRNLEAEQKAAEYILKQMRSEAKGKQLGCNNMRDSDIIAIRALHADGVSYAKLAEMFGKGKNANYIRNIVIGKLYKNVK